MGENESFGCLNCGWTRSSPSRMDAPASKVDQQTYGPNAVYEIINEWRKEMPEVSCRFVKITATRAIALDVISSYTYVKDAKLIKLVRGGIDTYVSSRNADQYPDEPIITRSILAIYSKVVLGGDQRQPERYEIYGEDADRVANILMGETWS